MSLFGIGVRTCVLNCFSRVRLLVTPWTVAQETRLSMGFSRQEYWSGLPFPSPLESAENCNFRPATTAFSSVQFSHSVVSDSLRPHESQHARPPCSSPSPGVHSDSRPSSQWCHPAISSSVVPFFSGPQSLPTSKSFPMSQLFTWGGQSTGVSASASFLPKKSQSWSPSEWTGWISLQSKGLSRVFCNTTVQKHQFSQLGTKQQQWEQAGHSPLIFSFLFSELGGRVILSAYENTRAPSGPFAWILTCNSSLPMNNSSIWITSACSVGEVCMLICMNKYVYWSAYLNISFLRSFLEVCICSTVMMLSTLSPVSSLSGFELVCTLTHLNFTSLS